MHTISSEHLSLDDLRAILAKNEQLELSEASRTAVLNCYNYLHNKIGEQGAVHYGINTGFGSLCDIQIEGKDLADLQANLVRSHASGTGDLVPLEVIKIILLLKIQNMSLGYSGVSIEVVDRLIEMYNEGVLPVIYQQGSLGASGDLAPLAHLALTLIGEGEVYYKGEREETATVLAELGWAPLVLQAKEGLALLNGTQFSTAYGVWSLLNAQQLSNKADLIAAMSMDAFLCRQSPFDARLHAVRPHQGQIKTAANIRTLLEDSTLAEAPRVAVQDPYAFRCVPQVHGASKDAFSYAAGVLETEINSVTDNPNVFVESDGILSGGNFHAQPVALVLDFMAIALAELGSISERRLYQLVGGERGLPAFLIEKVGLHSGLMITQYTAAGIVSQSKQYCTPASVDSIVSCNGQEDHVSMAANAGTKLYKVVENTERLLAIELLAATQALSLRKVESSSYINEVLTAYREVIPFITEDRVFSKDIALSVDFLKGLEVEL